MTTEASAEDIQRVKGIGDSDGWQRIEDRPDGLATRTEALAGGCDPDYLMTMAKGLIEEDESVDDGGGAMTGRQRELWRKKTALRNWLQQRRR